MLRPRRIHENLAGADRTLPSLSPSATIRSMRSAAPLWSLIPMLLAVFLSGAVDAKKLYQYRDANGVLHVSDQPPADASKVTDVKQTQVRADVQDIVEM